MVTTQPKIKTKQEIDILMVISITIIAYLFAECVNNLRHEISEFSHSNGSDYSQMSFV